MARTATIIGTATDWQSQSWDVRESKPTDHGFNLLIGWPQGEPRGRGGRGVAVIITPELAKYLLQTRLRDVTLPIGHTTTKRLRASLDIHWSWDDWWLSRMDDLLQMTLEAFCKKHGCSTGAASQRRTAIKPPAPSD